jgi:hypothetical protein
MPPWVDISKLLFAGALTLQKNIPGDNRRQKALCVPLLSPARFLDVFTRQAVALAPHFR